MFQVESFWNEEGGMGHDTYGLSVSELESALRILESAKNTRPDTDWIITVDAKLMKP